MKRARAAKDWLTVAAMSLVMSCGNTSTKAAETKLPQVPRGELRDVAAFGVIGDRAARSRAFFVEAGRVLTHPRCTNCHPNGDVPHQGMDLTRHEPPVVRGESNEGVPGNECATCHQDRNQELTRVPGAPRWHLAPIEMAWVGKSLHAICTQMKDPKRNGGKTLAQIAEHNAHDELVGWGWSPGAGREPAPGTQQSFGAIVNAWIETGAECPPEADR